MLENRQFKIFISIVFIQLISSKQVFAYLDPGTGSYIFQVLIAALIGGLVTIKMFWRKIINFIKNFFSTKH